MFNNITAKKHCPTKCDGSLLDSEGLHYVKI